MKEPLCKTCRNIFDFPNCCEEDLGDGIKIICHCRNYDKFEVEDKEREIDKEEAE